MRFLQEFHGRKSFERSNNALFIAIIPKKTGAINIRDFQPITLGEIGEFIQDSSKVLANCLKRGVT